VSGRDRQTHQRVLDTGPGQTSFDAALGQLDSVDSDFPTDDAGRLAGKAAAVVDDLERRLKAAEAERAGLEQSAARRRCGLRRWRGGRGEMWK